jgi:hypothetical protein
MKKQSLFSIFFYFCRSSAPFLIHILGKKFVQKKKEQAELNKDPQKNNIKNKNKDKEIDRHVICVLQKENSFNIQ